LERGSWAGVWQNGAVSAVATPVKEREKERRSGQGTGHIESPAVVNTSPSNFVIAGVC
jgi:hypothetical protein